MRHTLISLEFPDLPISAFRPALGKNRPATLEGGKGGSAPSAPNPYTTANAQTGLFQQNAAFNKALNLGNYSNPFGSQTSSISGYDPATGAPIYQTNVSASNDLQTILNQQLGKVYNTSDNFYSALSGLKGLNLDQNAAINAQNAGRDAAYQLQTQYLDPQYAQQQASMESKLAAQGLAPGSQAYSNAVQNFNNQKQQAYSNAQNQAILTGSQLGTQNLQNQINSGNFNAGLFGQQLQAGQLPYQNLQSIAGLVPGYTGIGTSGANPADIANAFQNQYLGQLGQYNAQQQARNATNSSLSGLAGGLLNAYRGGSTLNGLFGGGGGGYGSLLSSVSPGAAGYLGDLFGSSIGGVYGPSTQAGLDALIGSFSGGSGATAAGAGAAGAEAAGAGAGAAGAAEGLGGAGLGTAALAAAPFAIAAGGMLMGALGKGDNGTPYTRANDAWANAALHNPELLQIYGQGDVSNVMRKLYGGNEWTPSQYQFVQDQFAGMSGGGNFFGNFLNGPAGWGG